MASSILPAELGGQGRGTSFDVREISRGGLAGEAFSSRCPPDIQPNTRLIALCGITDYDGPLSIPSDSDDDDDEGRRTLSKRSKTGVLKDKLAMAFSTSKGKERREAKRLEKQEVTGKEGLASPQKCGWFFSDFYLFHHLFQGIGANQIWMTCESPDRLVKRYGAYAHGEATGDHRIVLDKTLLQQVNKFSNLRVFPSATLLEDFLRTLASEIKIAAQNRQPVLLLIFGHGDPGTYGIAVGGSGAPGQAPRLQTRHVIRAVGGLDVPLSMMLTSCYSGGWVYQPQLNITALTAAGPRAKSQGWGLSIGGRCHGSIWASAIKDSFIKMESEQATQYAPYPVAEEGAPQYESSIFAELARVIHDTLLHEVDVGLGHTHAIRFAAQDDRWSQEWRQRSGIPLSRFKERWDMLKRLAPQQGIVRGARPAGGIEAIGSMSLEPPIKGLYGLHPKFNKAQAIMVIRDLAHTYLSSFPGLRITGPDKETLVNSRKIMAGEVIQGWELDRLQEALTYRLRVMKLATEYQNMLGLNFEDCHMFDLEEWEARAGTTATSKGKAPETSGQRWNTFDTCRSMVAEAGLFPKPTPGQGWEFDKTWGYLAVAFVEAGFDAQTVSDALAKLLAGKVFSVASPRDHAVNAFL
ncbi:MAG: hypothetical protein Q9172_001535 [Xanthocarpia lactea]